MAFATISQKANCSSIGRASARPSRVSRTPVIVKASLKDNVQAVGQHAATAALAVALCVMAPAPAQALKPFKQEYQNMERSFTPAKDAVNNVSGATQNAFNNVRDAFGQNISNAGDAKNVVSNKVQEAKQTFGNPAAAVKDNGRSVLDKVKSVVPIAALPEIRDKVSDDINNTKGKAQEVKGAVDNKLGFSPADAIGDAAKNAKNTVDSKLGFSPADSVADAAKSAKGKVDNALGFSPADNVADAAKGAFDGLKGAFPLGKGPAGTAAGTGEGVAAGKAKEQQTQADASGSGQKVKDFVLGTSYGKQ